MNIRASIRIRLDRFKGRIRWRITDKLGAKRRRSKLRNTDFSIICNNCLAGGIYHKLGLPYTSPTVGLFFYLGDYIRFLENFNYYINQPLTFKSTSVYSQANELRKTANYPLGDLGDNIEIHFLHNKDEAEAAEKWERRKKRLNYDNLFFIYSDHGDFHEEYLERYKKLPFKNKIFFSAKPRKGDCVVFVRDYENEKGVGDSAIDRKYEKYIDVIKWLNGEKVYVKKQ